MEIQVSKIKEELNNLSNLIDNYELNYLNLYNIVNDMSNYWQDHHANIFFKDIELRKIEISNTINEIKDIKELYNYLVLKYENIGNNFKFDFTIKENIFNNIDNCLNKCQTIINSYLSLNLSFCNGYYINNGLSKLINTKERLTNYREKLKKAIDYIEETEKEITRKIANINIEDIKEVEIDKYI